MKRGKNDRRLWEKLCFTGLILLIYICGRRIPLYGIDRRWYEEATRGTNFFLNMAIGGDAYKISLLALGISPIMIASILVSAVSSIRRASTKSRISVDRMEHIRYGLALAIAVVQAGMTALTMHFVPTVLSLVQIRILAAVELILGTVLIMALLGLNKEYGIGGQSVLIVVNLTESLLAMVKGSEQEALVIPALCALDAVIVTLIMENVEFRIPVQRIFIFNIYKDKNYIAIKGNPVGVLPVMFSSAIFGLVRLAVGAIAFLLPQQQWPRLALGALDLNRPVGIGIYVAIIYLLTVGVTFIMLNPREMAQQLLQSNDSICHVCSGKPTRAYLARRLFLIALLSATVMGVCVIFPMVLRMRGLIDEQLAMLPSATLMLTSILANLYRELKTAISFEAYRTFL